MNNIYPGSMLMEITFEVFEWPNILAIEKIKTYIPVIQPLEFISDEINEVVVRLKKEYWGTKEQNRHLHVRRTHASNAIRLFDEVKK